MAAAVLDAAAPSKAAAHSAIFIFMSDFSY
jgi:hypothetical protein